MKKKLSLAVIVLTMLFVALTFSVGAAKSGKYTYEVCGGEATITDVSDTLSGDVAVPSKLGGYPVTSIGMFAFESSKITSVKIPDTVTSIVYGAFSDCRSLKTVNIPSTVESLDWSAFQNCTSLKKVTVGSGFEGWLQYVFPGCTALTDIVVADGNKKYATQDGVLFNKDKTQLVFCPPGKSGSYTIPNSVKTVMGNAFEYCTKLKKITLGSRVSDFEQYKVAGCTSLTEIAVNSSNSTYSAKNGVLFSKDKTRLIVYPKGKSGAYTVPSTVKKIEDRAFKSCDKLTGVTIPSSVNTIGEYAFSHCNGLTSVTIPSSVNTIDCGVFFMCGNLKTVKLPKSVTTIGSDAFYGCSSLKTVWYTGSRIIHIDHWNDDLLDATWHYNTCSGSHTYTNRCDATCNKCDWKRTAPHNYKTTVTKATMTKNGKIVKACTTCGKTVSTKVVYRPYSVKVASKTYNGSVQKPTVTVKGYDGKVIPSSNYTVSRVTGCKTAGTHKLLIKMKGNYSGSKTVSFTIKPISIAKCSVKLSVSEYMYTGKVRVPSVVVKNAGGTVLQNGTHYTVSRVTGCKNVGTHKLLIKMKGNYGGSKTVTYKITPPKTTVSKVTPATKSLKVSITKKSTQVTGYQVQYATTKSFKSPKTKTVSSYKTTATTLSGLKAKTTYYVRVRTYKTVNGTKYYSGWSTAKYAKTK